MGGCAWVIYKYCPMLYKALEHLWILVSTQRPRTNPPQIPRDNCVFVWVCFIDLCICSTTNTTPSWLLWLHRCIHFQTLNRPWFSEMDSTSFWVLVLFIYFWFWFANIFCEFLHLYSLEIDFYFSSFGIGVMLVSKYFGKCFFVFYFLERIMSNWSYFFFKHLIELSGKIILALETSFPPKDFELWIQLFK